MSRVFFARQKQYYTAKISREQKQQSTLQEALNTEQAKQSNNQRQFHMLKSIFDYVTGGSLFGSGSSGLLGSIGMNGYNSDSSFCNGLLSGGANLFAGLSGLGFGNGYSDMYDALGLSNDFENFYDANAYSDIKCDDLQMQIEALKSQIEVDKAELKALTEGEKNAIETGASKY